MCCDLPLNGSAFSLIFLTAYSLVFIWQWFCNIFYIEKKNPNFPSSTVDWNSSLLLELGREKTSNFHMETCIATVSGLPMPAFDHFTSQGAHRCGRDVPNSTYFLIRCIHDRREPTVTQCSEFVGLVVRTLLQRPAAGVFCRKLVSLLLIT